jgi:hypothetical protein
MTQRVEELIENVHRHRCYTHPIFRHWVVVNPSPEVIGAFFHQVQCFCAATRPGLKFPEALALLGLQMESELLQEIVDSEVDHGPALATMVGFILNQAAKDEIFNNLYDQVVIENKLKDYSNQLLGCLPGYDLETGLVTQARKAIAVFERRKLMDTKSTLINLGTALALEMISNNHLIPGEKYCLIDGGLYKTNMKQREMQYIVEHWGCLGAEQQHEEKITRAVSSVLSDETQPLIEEGANDLLNSLVGLWDLLDAALLQSGYK